jgi:N-carbamoyl-L-amino-acid hydrolase
MMLTIRRGRLYASLDALGRIGSFIDPRNGLRGVNRLALTQADGEGRRQLVAWMREAGLAVTVDRIGNIYGRRAGAQDDLAPVMIGSHIDSVETGGRFDGCLGVLGGLEIVHTLNDAGVTTARPLVVAAFTEQEGARFGIDLLGSAVATGRIPLSQAYELRDREGKRLVDELTAIGFRGDAPELLAPPHVYLECHIEQGPTLRAEGAQLGVVTGVQASGWNSLSLVGKTAHAGATPMHLRADAGVAAARINLRLREMIQSGKYGDLRATMGVLQALPGLVNVVPGEVRCTIDLRNPDDEAMRRAENDIAAYAVMLSSEEGVQLNWKRTARSSTVSFAPEVRERIAASMKARGRSFRELVSGAGHDAQEMARITRAGMIFVPGEFDGVSHSPRELSTEEQCGHGIDVLLDVALRFAEET